VGHGAGSAAHLGLDSYHGVSPPVSVVILTQNESANIAECLRSCAWSDDVHVVDSGSTDHTVSIARSMGAHVHHNPFRSFGQQRNWAIDHVPFKHLWQFHLDADERFTADLVFEMLHEIGIQGVASDKAGYRVCNRLMFLDHWLRRSANFPAYQVRLIHAKRCRFIDCGHGQREQTTGSIGTMASPYLHFPFNSGLMQWLARHDLYSDREADHALAGASESHVGRNLFSRDVLLRRRALKQLSFRLPARSFCRFVYQYLLMGGFREGRAGYTYCQMLVMYEGWIEQKMRRRDGELSRQIKRLITEYRRAGAQREFDLDHIRATIFEFRHKLRQSLRHERETESANITGGVLR